MSFGRLERTPGPQPMSEINMTPLIDVMLVLLVIFIITAPLLTSAIKLDLPKTEAPKAEAPRAEAPAKSRNGMVDESARYGESLLREMLGAEPIIDKNAGK